MIYAKLTEELKSAPKTDNPEYTIFLRNLVMSYELNDLYEYFVPIIEDPDIDKDIRFSAYYSWSDLFQAYRFLSDAKRRLGLSYRSLP